MIPPDDFVQSFLKAANENEIAAVVVYGARIEGKPILRMATNRDKESAGKIMSWIRGTDARAILAAAQHVHDRAGGCYICTAYELASGVGSTWLDSKHRPWDQLGDYDQQQHIKHVVEILEVIKQLSAQPIVTV